MVAAAFAASHPAWPAPTTMTSYEEYIFVFFEKCFTWKLFTKLLKVVEKVKRDNDLIKKQQKTADLSAKSAV
ncbi:hypothetical protein GCM10027185_45060 [Spirosoma pulveris]